MGSTNYGWLAAWVPSQDWLSRILELFDVSQTLTWSRRPWRKGSTDLAPTFHGIPWHLPYNWRKWRKSLSQDSRNALGCSAPQAIRLVDSAIAGEGHDWPRDTCRSSLSRQTSRSTLVQRKYLPSKRSRGFLTSANFESNLAVRILMCSANSGTPTSSCICLLLTYQGTP